MNEEVWKRLFLRVGWYDQRDWYFWELVYVSGWVCYVFFEYKCFIMYYYQIRIFGDYYRIIQKQKGR